MELKNYKLKITNSILNGSNPIICVKIVIHQSDEFV